MQVLLQLPLEGSVLLSRVSANCAFFGSLVLIRLTTLPLVAIDGQIPRCADDNAADIILNAAHWVQLILAALLAVYCRTIAVRAALREGTCALGAREHISAEPCTQEQYRSFASQCCHLGVPASLPNR